MRLKLQHKAIGFDPSFYGRLMTGVVVVGVTAEGKLHALEDASDNFMFDTACHQVAKLASQHDATLISTEHYQYGVTRMMIERVTIVPTYCVPQIPRYDRMIKLSKMILRGDIEFHFDNKKIFQELEQYLEIRCGSTVRSEALWFGLEALDRLTRQKKVDELYRKRSRK